LEDFWKTRSQDSDCTTTCVFGWPLLHHEGMAAQAQELHRAPMPLSTPTSLRPKKADYLAWARNLQLQNPEIGAEDEEQPQGTMGIA
jgi:hypothetical protein